MAGSTFIAKKFSINALGKDQYAAWSTADHAKKKTILQLFFKGSP